MHWYHPKKATCQKRKKVIRQFLRNQAFNRKVDDDGRRRTTDDGRRTTDESALEKLRCLSAGGAKKPISNLHSSKINYLCNHIHGRRQQNSQFKNFNIDANSHLSSGYNV